MKSQFPSNHETSSGCISRRGSVLLSQMHGLPHRTNFGSLYSCFIVTNSCAPNHSLYAGKNFIPPRMSSNTAYSAVGAFISSSPEMRPTVYMWLPSDLAHVVLPVLVGPKATNPLRLVRIPFLLPVTRQSMLVQS